ncbi:MAG: hypothetical protein AB1416_05775, partial [Actinomycetota bacterium]
LGAMAPHLLHHVGLVAGGAFLAGATGTWLFGLVALGAMVPMLVRLRRRTGGWRVPALLLAVMAVVFAVSRSVM